MVFKIEASLLSLQSENQVSASCSMCMDGREFLSQHVKVSPIAQSFPEELGVYSVSSPFNTVKDVFGV